MDTTKESRPEDTHKTNKKRKQQNDVEDIITALDIAKQRVLDISYRALVAEHLTQKTWDIWAYCRDNQRSLDSGRHCKMIKEMVLGAVGHVVKELESTRQELMVKNVMLSQEKKTARQLAKQLSEASERIRILEQDLSKTNSRLAGQVKAKSNDATSVSAGKPSALSGALEKIKLRRSLPDGNADGYSVQVSDDIHRSSIPAVD